jgi:AraC family transcriptional activator of mtrCDE
MDALSHLLSLYPFRTELDVRCHFGAPWTFEKSAAASGVVPYHMVLTGKAWLDAAGHEQIPLRSGDILLFPRGVAHRIYTENAELASQPYVSPLNRAVTMNLNDGSGPVTDLLCGRFEFSAERGTALLDALPEIVLVHDTGSANFQSLSRLMSMLTVETDGVREGGNNVIPQLAAALFAMVMRVWIEQMAPAPGLFSVLADERLKPALQGILDAPGKPWSLEHMAEACSMSRATFARHFAQVSGTTPAALLLQTRMVRAASWMGDNRPLAAIGAAVGYRSEAAFHRAFKRSFGVGPGQYRRALAQQQ